MSNREDSVQDVVQPQWRQLRLPQILFSPRALELHTAILNDWDNLRQSACQTAAGRALWEHVTGDPLAELLAGERHLTKFHEKIKNDLVRKTPEISGVILAVRTLWFDSKLAEALKSMRGDGDTQVVLLGAGMDTRAYRLSCLKESNVFEVDFPEVLQVKADLLEVAVGSNEEERRPALKARSLNYVATDIRKNDWYERLKNSGFEPERKTVWVLEGVLYYLTESEARQVLTLIADKCPTVPTVLLADFINKPSLTMCSSLFHFCCDWPDHLLSSLGYSHVKLSQIGDPDAHFGLIEDSMNLFHKLRSLPRSQQTCPQDGTPCCRIYLVQASGQPIQSSR